MDSIKQTSVAEYERRDVEQFYRLNTNRRGPGAPEGNTNRLKHGIYANRFFSEEEQAVYESVIGSLRDDYPFNESSDFIQVELVAIYFLKLGRAMEHKDYYAAQKLDSMLRGHLKDLKRMKEDTDDRVQ
jgi:hypothetical protein